MNRQAAYQRGFTLIEILVAIAVFAVVAAMAYGGLEGIVNQRHKVRDSMDRLKTLQQGFTIISRDLNQATTRAIRDTADSLPKGAFAGSTKNIPALVLTRGGWANPLGDRRATLERVAYKIDDDKLLRLSWPTLDRAREMKPRQQVLFDHVVGFHLRFLDANGKWLHQWPPLNQPANKYLERLPRAVKIQVDLKDAGLITRIMELP
jgi:general secretion pathway protein J